MEQARQGLNGLCLRGCHSFQRARRLRPGNWLTEHRHLLLGGIAARIAKQQRLIAGGQEAHECVRLGAARPAKVRLDRRHGQAAALADSDEGVVMGAVLIRQAGLIGV